MLRTNSKKYQENFRNYIISAVNVTDHDTSATTDAEKIAFVMSCYDSEFNHKYNQVRHPNEQDRFANWLAGLPSVLDIPFYPGKIIELAKQLQEVDTYPNEKSTTKNIVKNYFNFMACNIIKINSKLNK
tara:strand:- start:1198 stop:1584 length:387 start_codon:yes stop_codon:yes gene_type:complete